MGIREQHTVLFGPDHGSIRLPLERNADPNVFDRPLHSLVR